MSDCSFWSPASTAYYISRFMKQCIWTPLRLWRGEQDGLCRGDCESRWHLALSLMLWVINGLHGSFVSITNARGLRFTCGSYSAYFSYSTVCTSETSNFQIFTQRDGHWFIGEIVEFFFCYLFYMQSLNLIRSERCSAGMGMQKYQGDAITWKLRLINYVCKCMCLTYLIRAFPEQWIKNQIVFMCFWEIHCSFTGFSMHKITGDLYCLFNKQIMY